MQYDYFGAWPWLALNLVSINFSTANYMNVATMLQHPYADKMIEAPRQPCYTVLVVFAHMFKVKHMYSFQTVCHQFKNKTSTSNN